MHHMRTWIASLSDNEFGLLKLVIDKLLLGAIVAGVGFFVWKAMQRYKRSQALSLELGKQCAAALVRASTSLALLEQKMARLVGGPVGEMRLDDNTDVGVRSFRERLARTADEFIAESNKVGAQITEDLVLLGGAQADAVPAYFGAILRLFDAGGNSSIASAIVEHLIQQVPKARKALAAYFPPLDRAAARPMFERLRAGSQK